MTVVVKPALGTCGLVSSWYTKRSRIFEIVLAWKNLGLKVAIEILFQGLQAASFPTAFHLMILFCEILEFKRTNLNELGSHTSCI